MDKTFQQLIKEYDTYIKIIKANRKKIRADLTENRMFRLKFEKVKDQLEQYTRQEIKNGRTLYQIFMDNFGKVTPHFFALYKILNKQK